MTCSIDASMSTGDEDGTFTDSTDTSLSEEDEGQTDSVGTSSGGGSGS